jgi:hypothetical protein
LPSPEAPPAPESLWNWLVSLEVDFRGFRAEAVAYQALKLVQPPMDVSSHGGGTEPRSGAEKASLPIGSYQMPRMNVVP